MLAKGPMVVVAETPAADAVEMLGKAGAFPIIETSWADARAAIDEIQPCALLLAEAEPPPDPRNNDLFPSHKPLRGKASKTRPGGRPFYCATAPPESP